MTGKEAMLLAFDRLFDRAAKKLGIECNPEEKEESKRQFAERFAALLEALHRVNVDELPDEVLAGMEGAIDRITPTEVVGLLASIPIAHQGHEMLRGIAYRAAEQRLLEHLIQQADERYGGN
ncbi:MAG: hypothetical protein ACREQ9_02465 [Candidatus Binatia bacterium]